MTTINAARPTLADLVSHMERSHELARQSEVLATAADANDAELDRLIASSGYTLAEVTEALQARWAQ